MSICTDLDLTKMDRHNMRLSGVPGSMFANYGDIHDLPCRYLRSFTYEGVDKTIRVSAKKQEQWLEKMYEDPWRTFIACIGSKGDDLQAKRLAVNLAYWYGGHPGGFTYRWEQITRTVVARHTDEKLLFLSNVHPSSSTLKKDILADALALNSDIPCIVVTAGNPREFMDSVGWQANYSFYLERAEVKEMQLL